MREREERVGGAAGEQRPRLGRLESVVGGELRRRDRVEAEPRDGQGMFREADERSEDVLGDLGPLVGPSRQEAVIGCAVEPELGRGLGDVAFEHHRASGRDCMAERGVWLDPLEPVLCERELGEERRPHCQRVERRADVVPESGKRQFLGSGAAADRLCALDDEHLAPGLGESGGG